MLALDLVETLGCGFPFAGRHRIHRPVVQLLDRTLDIGRVLGAAGSDQQRQEQG